MATDIAIETRTITSVNPATQENLKTYPCATASEVQDAVSRAHIAQAAWNSCGIRKRIDALQVFQRLLHERKSDVARVITSEAGKPYVEALLTEVLAQPLRDTRDREVSALLVALVLGDLLRHVRHRVEGGVKRIDPLE